MASHLRENFHVHVDRALTGAFNMLRDAALMDDVRASQQAVVRLYAWQPYAVSIGYNQDASTIDAGRCAERGIDIVRRPTGGRAVLHAEEITYAVVTPLGDHSARDWYALIHQTIAKGLSTLGLEDAAFVKSNPNFGEHYKQTSGAICFTSSARYELEWQGKKFVGSAQRVIDGVLLQHGSILLGPYHNHLPELLVMDDAKREAMKNILRAKSISLGEILGRIVSFEECATPLRDSFLEMNQQAVLTNIA